MIFVTVGTHEQPFNRLLEYVDQLKKENIITDPVVVQSGFSTYTPQCCEWKRLYPYQEMIMLVEKADIIITHGGPSSFLMPLQIGKIPIVVPRQYEYREHVNNHQVLFSKTVAERLGNIIVIENIKDLKNVLLDYENITANMPSKTRSNNARFNQEFENLVNELFYMEP